VRSLLIETHYIPCIAYFSLLLKFENVILECHENFIKQSYRNRCYINTSHGTEVLTVPLTSKHGKVAITEVRIDYNQKWLNNHWRTIQSAYGKAPFFEFYADELHDVLFYKYDFLYELNRTMLSLCLKWLKQPLEIEESMSYEVEPLAGITDHRNAINAKNNEGSNKYYKPVTYNQVFGNKFVNNLSLIDLIFCAGPQAKQIVQASAVEW
jgi:hypothetical protein